MDDKNRCRFCCISRLDYYLSLSSSYQFKNLCNSLFLPCDLEEALGKVLGKELVESTIYIISCID